MSEHRAQDRVLLFEDDMRQALQLQGELSEAYVVDVASDMAEALFLAAEHEYAAVITDLFIEVRPHERTPKGGVSLISKFRNGLGGAPAWGRAVPIIAITGAAPFNGYDPLQTASTIGASVVLRKPIDTGQLIGLLQSLIETSSDAST